MAASMRSQLSARGCPPACPKQQQLASVRCRTQAANSKQAWTQVDFDRRSVLAGMAALLIAGTPAAEAKESFLASTGGKGFLAEEEQALYNLRLEKEAEALKEIQAEREVFEKEARNSQIGKLCATPFGIDIVGITEFVALVGALVGGISARQRKAELERLNEQLRKINMGLRQQARSGTVYAPGLSYAPSNVVNGNGSQPLDGIGTAAEVVRATAATITLPKPAPTSSPVSAPVTDRTLFSMDEEEMSSDQIQCRDALRSGKRFLKETNGSAAMVRFEKALMLSKALDNKVQERRATRGLAAAARLQGQYRMAIDNLERVLEISKQMQEYTGDADAYGTIADCWTDLGEFEKAAAYYDKYIQCMARDGPV